MLRQGTNRLNQRHGCLVLAVELTEGLAGLVQAETGVAVPVRARGCGRD